MTLRLNGDRPALSGFIAAVADVAAAQAARPKSVGRKKPRPPAI